MGRTWDAGRTEPVGDDDYRVLPTGPVRARVDRAASAVEGVFSALTHAVERAKINSDDPAGGPWRRSASVLKP